MINIAVQTILKELRSGHTPGEILIQISTHSDSSSSPNMNSLGNLVAYSEALAADPVGKCRAVVIACRVSGKRRAELQMVICTGNELNWWTPQICQVQLLQDCETHCRIIELYPVSYIPQNKICFD